MKSESLYWDAQLELSNVCPNTPLHDFNNKNIVLDLLLNVILSLRQWSNLHRYCQWVCTEIAALGAIFLIYPLFIWEVLCKNDIPTRNYMGTIGVEFTLRKCLCKLNGDSLLYNCLLMKIYIVKGLSSSSLLFQYPSATLTCLSVRSIQLACWSHRCPRNRKSVWV